MRVPMRGAAITLLILAMLTAGPARAQPAPLDGVLTRLVASDDLAGAVGVVADGDMVLRSSAGYADVDTRAPFAPPTHVRVASITKTFVAAAVLQLVGENRIHLDAPVDTYLPGVLRGEGIDGAAITVRQLLRHQRGLPEYFDDSTEPPATPVAARELLSWALAKPGSPPGQPVPVYTNTNYVVAGLILEAVTGSPAAGVITRRIIEPLGLAHTYFPAAGDSWLRAPMAHGYELVDGRRRDVTASEPSGEYMAGSLISTNEDTAAFLTALVDGRVLARPELAQMTDTVSWPLHGPGFRYGLGLTSIDLDCGVRVWGHGGDLAGYHSVVVGEPGGRAVSVTFTQGAPGVATIVDDPRFDVVNAVFCPS
ncbi:D-alanyl-D-alanine carboxypeptidase [Mycolicibacterium iranicum]|uniref:D-alanyl-D-alanine carboxypeptidase n=1 Tax=Mycolicibacterium iranicum TaxID=912594 RepID=A0A839Q7V0_MYCIR|nr:serine hydrolase domain-containing protein [Mycolicibacterium iranicum]MBB2990914.1 D-alanyl-D-alanine carboxypeptidase [Mycolicibacterium iranicum]